MGSDSGKAAGADWVIMAEIVILQGAEQDLLELYKEIFSVNEDRADRFSSAVDQAMATLSSFPEIGRVIAQNTRRKLVPQFNEYGIFYVVENQRVMIHAVLDLRQDPEQLRRRLQI